MSMVKNGQKWSRKSYNLDILYLYFRAKYFEVQIFYFQEWAIIKGYTCVESLCYQKASAEMLSHFTANFHSYHGHGWIHRCYLAQFLCSSCHFCAEHLWPHSLFLCASNCSCWSITAVCYLFCPFFFVLTMEGRRAAGIVLS